MTGISQLEKEQSVQVVEADMLDKMNETNALIAQRAYEIYQSRRGGHGSDRDDWFGAEEEALYPLEVDRDESDGVLRLTAQLPGFDAKDLEVAIGHRGPSFAASTQIRVSHQIRVARVPRLCRSLSSRLMSIHY